MLKLGANRQVINIVQAGNQHFHTRDTFLINILSNVVRGVMGEGIQHSNLSNFRYQ
jgi:hypothetical protein